MAGWEQAALVKSGGKEHLVPTDQRPGFTGFVWRNLAESEQPGIAEEMANAGYKVILCNADALYLDMAYEKAPDEPAPIGPVSPICVRSSISSLSAARP